MTYLYYPGCSLKGTGKAYEESVRAVFDALGVPLKELDDWNCCGATAYMAIDELKAFTLAVRNLVLAERQSGQPQGSAVDLVVPCNACYLVLTKAHRYMNEYAEIGRKIEGVLDAAGLHYEGRVNVRHPLDVLVNDIGLEKISAKVSRALSGLHVACYYGCQMVRPYATFDNQRNPTKMDELMEAL
ncbi:MAG: heterodisulfide reductase-related iron-sulfur binding cluster, partial [bacterium]